jgi:hypothetical protein
VVLLHEALEFARVDMKFRLSQGFQNPVMPQFRIMIVETPNFSGDTFVNRLVSA